MKQRKDRIAMKKIFSTSLIAAMMIACCVIFLSCGKETQSKDSENSIIGQWTMTAAEYGGETLTEEDLKSSEMLTEMPKLELSEDATFVFEAFGTLEEGTVEDQEDGLYVLKDHSGNEFPMELNQEGNIELEYESMSMVLIFEKEGE